MTIFKAGFMMSVRGGSGLVLTRLPDGTWSAPSAIISSGIGGGAQFGAEFTDFVFILNTAEAVDAFSRGGNITLGGNLSVTAGPFGRNAEASISPQMAPILSYSKSKGFFGGISFEGTGIIDF